jgi:hypothetical protein
MQSKKDEAAHEMWGVYSSQVHYAFEREPERFERERAPPLMSASALASRVEQ